VGRSQLLPPRQHVVRLLQRRRVDVGHRDDASERRVDVAEKRPALAADTNEPDTTGPPRTGSVRGRASSAASAGVPPALS
jgi:hypothetical protein